MAFEQFQEVMEGLGMEEETDTETQEGGKGKTKGLNALDVEKFLLHYNKEIVNIKQVESATFYCLNQCPFNEDHSTNEAAIVQQKSGKLSFQCFHNSCKDKTWFDFRNAVSGSDTLKPFFREIQDSTGFLNKVYNRYYGAIFIRHPCEGLSGESVN